MEEAFKRACYLANEWTINRYLMANADGRWNGAEKAQRHADLCEFYVKALTGVRDTGHGVCEHFKQLHRATEDGLTDHLDEVIGFPLKGRPDYDTLVPAFFEKWHEIAMNIFGKDE